MNGGWKEGRSWYWIETVSIHAFINLMRIIEYLLPAPCWALWELQDVWDLKSV